MVLSNTKVMTNAARIFIPMSPTNDNNTPDKRVPIIAEGTAAIRPHFATLCSACPDLEWAMLLPRLTIRTKVSEATIASLISQSNM